jgi:hypothetical protein
MKKNGLTFSAFAVMIAIILVAVFAVKPIVNIAHCNDIFTARLITPGTYNSTIDSSDPSTEYDYYKIVVSAGQTLSVNETPANTLRAYLYLIEPDQSTTANYSQPSAMGFPAMASWTTNSLQASYTYYIELDAWEGAGTYSMTVSLKSQNDGNSGGDAGDDYFTATKLPSVNATYPGFVADDDVYDYYKIVLLGGDSISVTVTPVHELRPYLYLVKPDQSTTANSSLSAMGLPAAVSWTTNSASVNYTYFIEVELWQGQGNYTTKIVITPQNDANSGGDAGNSFDTATALSTGTYSGFLKNDDVDDYYKTTQNVTAGQGLYVTVIPSHYLSVQINLYNPARNSIGYNGSNVGVPTIAGARALSTQFMYIDIHLASGYGNYTMKIVQEPILGKPTQTPQTPNPGQSVKISVSATAPQKGIGEVVLSYRTNQSTTWVNVLMNKNSTTGMYEGTIPGFSATTNVTYMITGNNTAGDYFVQNNAGIYYTYRAIPEFSSMSLLLIVFCTSAVFAVLSRRKKIARLGSLQH